MKVCPACQADFQNGFQYCPYDLCALLTSAERAPRLWPVAQVSVQAAVPYAVQLRANPLEDVLVAPFYQPGSDGSVGNQATNGEKKKVTAVKQPLSSAQERDAASGLSLLLPEPDSLITRLAAALQECVKGFGQKAQCAHPAQALEATSDISLLMPEPGSLIACLSVAIREFVRGFGRSASAAPSDGAATGISFSIPEPGSLIPRLIAALRQFVRDFGKAAPLAPALETAEFRFLLKDEPLTARIKRELMGAALELRRDPRGFLVGLLRGEGNSRWRQHLLQSGVAVAVIAYCIIFTSLLLAGLFISRQPVEATRKEELTVLTRLIDLPAVAKTDSAPKDIPKGKGGFTGGSKPKIEQAHGGGGGGRNQPTPPSLGVPPPLALTPQIVLPNPEPPKIKNPTLPVPMTVFGDPKALAELKGPIGDPLGIPVPPSSGPGKGAGIGTGEGTGVGPGQGGGVGPGRGGNAGGDDFALGGGRGPGGSGGVEEAGRNGAGKPVILYKEKARYTEEARQNKIQGTVTLSGIFTADGRITDIRVVRGLPDGLTEKAIAAALKIRFQPATKDGMPVSVRAYLEFSFALY